MVVGVWKLVARFKLLMLLPLPLLMASLTIGYKHADGPYWMGSKTDPSYYYLLGSLAYAVGQPSMCCLHPGVTVQVNGSWVLRSVHMVIGEDDLVSDVLRDPEVYAKLLGFEETLLYALALMAAGWIVYRATGRLELAVLTQMQPFLEPAIFQWLNPIAPEVYLYALGILTTALAVAYVLSAGSGIPMALAFGVLAGMGIAAKITYLPVVIMPLLLLRSWWGRIVYLLTTCASFAAISFRHWATVDNALYFGSLLLHQRGLHGSGAPGRPQLFELLSSTLEYFRSDAVYTSLLFASIVLAACFLWFGRSKDGHLRRAAWPLLAFSICAALQVGLASRQFNLRYLSPAYPLFIASVILALFSIAKTYAAADRAIRVACVVTVTAIVAGATFHVRGEMMQLGAAQRQLTLLDRKERQGRPDSAIVAYYGAGTIPFALHSGNVWVYRRFSAQLEALYPNMVFWDAYRRTFERFDAPLTSVDLGECNSLLLQGTPFGAHPMDFSPPDHTLVEEVGGSRAEAYYKLISGPCRTSR
jgi:hypothetical protein